MNIVNVQIDIDTPTGRKLLRELQKHPKVAKVEQELPEELAKQKMYTLEEVFDSVEDKLNNHYGTDLKLEY